MMQLKIAKKATSKNNKNANIWYDPFNNTFKKSLTKNEKQQNGVSRIQIDVPRFSKQELKVFVEGRSLTITGENTYRKFFHSLILPNEVDINAIVASLNKNILTLFLHHNPKILKKEIPISTNISILQ